MDVAEADFDIKLQKISADLTQELDKSLPALLRRQDANGGSRVRSRVRAREVDWMTGSLLDPFQELPQLLDPHLPRWIPFLAEAYLEHLRLGSSGAGRRRTKQAAASSSKLLVSVGHAICKILYTFCKIRGEKVIVHFLNVETRYLELLLTAFEEAEVESKAEDEVKEVGAGDHGSQSDKWTWEQRYIVLLWLSHLLLAPFDLSTISSVDLEESSMQEIPGLTLPENLPGITQRVIPLAIKYLASPGKERDGAKALLARMAMRRDMQQLGVLKCLVDWALSSLSGSQGDEAGTVYCYLGVLSFLAAILRSSSHTSDMEPYLASIFHRVYGMAEDNSSISKTITSFALARKMILKVIRSVIITLLRHSVQDMASTELTENAIAYLLESLSDNDTPVRLAASKSLSIITLKLDSDMASQVVDAVLESLNRNVLWKKTQGGTLVRDLAAVDYLEWHGLMLTLSHLLYRRSPPQEQLSDIVHALLLGLSFEQRSTAGTSVGANVRDAACFGVWALARRYTSQELLAVPTKSVFAAKAHPESSSILQVLATELVTSASLDPAGNIRRGASAALQELIGRHPDTVEKGIWVVQTVDYHAVARRSRAVEEVALGAVKLSSQYGHAILDAILGWRGVGDPDAASRRVAGASFGILTAEMAISADGEVFAGFDTSVKQLVAALQALEKRQVEERHGLLLCLAATLEQVPRLLSTADKVGLTPETEAAVDHILSEVSLLLDSQNALSSRRPELIAEAGGRLVMSFVPLLQAKLLGTQSLTGSSQFYEPGASSPYLHFASTTQTTLAKDPFVEKVMIKLRDILPTWLTRNEPDAIEPASCAALTVLVFSYPEDREAILESWASAVRTKPTSRTASRGEGYFHALASAQPLAHLAHGSDVVCDALLQRWAADPDIETRVAILQSLARSQVLIDRPLLFLSLLSDGLNDYTTTARGDVGSLVRMQALKAVRVLWQDVQVTGGSASWFAESIKSLFYSTLRLSAEKLDRVRPEAQIAISLLMGRE